MLAKRYMQSTKNVPAIMKKIVEGTAPAKFSVEHLKGLGFKSSSDRGIIPLLKELGFLTEDGTPTPRYHSYRDPSQSRKVLGEALKTSYSDLFTINEKLSERDRPAVEGKFKTTHNATDRIAQDQAALFFAFAKLADFDGTPPKPPTDTKKEEHKEDNAGEGVKQAQHRMHLNYNIQVHLPATKDVDVYNAIFKSIRDNLLG